MTSSYVLIPLLDEWGSGGRMFESSHPDQKPFPFSHFLAASVAVRLALSQHSVKMLAFKEVSGIRIA